MVDRETLIVRQSCLKAAVDHCLNKPDHNVLDVAQKFELWVNRQ